MGTNRLRTASSTSAQQRQPKGIKDGGQFAGSSNPESSLQLVAHDVDTDMDGVAETQRIARHFIRRYGLHDHTVNGYMDSDDLTQDAVMAYLVASKTDRPEGAPLPVGVIAKRSIIRALDSGSHRSKGNYSAMKLFDQIRAKREVEVDRPLTSTELDESAQALRMSMPASHRPGVGFHRSPTSTAQFDSMLENQVDRVMFDISSREVSVITDDFSKGTFGDRAAQLKSDGDQVGARALAWDAIAEHSGAPLCTTTPIGKRAAIRARSSVAQAGGPLSCAKSYLETGETTDEFFAPFGPIDDDARYAVCETLTRHENYADDLWRIAISQAEGRSA
jgi:hypothetical protein